MNAKPMICPRPRLHAPILLYHSIFKEIPEEFDGNNIHNVNPETFKRQINWLQTVYKIVPLEELFSSSSSGPNVCAITFDDAYKSVLDNAVPFLQKENIPATIFLNSSSLQSTIFWRDKLRIVLGSNYIDEFIHESQNNFPLVGFNKQNIYKKSKTPIVNSKEFDVFLSLFISKYSLQCRSQTYCLDSISRLRGLPSNIKIGNHTANHYLLSSLTKSDQFFEIASCKQVIADSLRTDQISDIFSVPFGGLNDFNMQTCGVLKDLSINKILLSRNRLNYNSMFDLRIKPGVLSSSSIIAKERFMAAPSLNRLKRQIFKLKLAKLYHWNNP